jgi:nucleotide-binding universal stress UspA family protein
MKVLIAYDGSLSADNSLNDLSRAGLPRDAEALIVNVQESWLPQLNYLNREVTNQTVIYSETSAAKTAFSAEEKEISVVNEKSPILVKALEKLTALFPDWHIETLLLSGSPSYEITQKAREWKADLVVAGSQGKTKFKFSHLGSVSQKIANEVECSARIVRGNIWKNGSPNRILVGLDCTRGSILAIEEVAKRMWIMGSEVRLVLALDSCEQKTKWLIDYIRSVKKKLENADLIVSELIEEGDPKQIIINASEEWGADCIFLGANDTEKHEKNHLLGSVSTAVIARAHCTVEIVRETQQRQ